MKNGEKATLDKNVQLRILEVLPADFDLAQSILCCILAYMCELMKIDNTSYSVHMEGNSYEVKIQRIKSMEAEIEG